MFDAPSAKYSHSVGAERRKPEGGGVPGSNGAVVSSMTMRQARHGGIGKGGSRGQEWGLIGVLLGWDVFGFDVALYGAVIGC